jgi:hypothetical protein
MFIEEFHPRLAKFLSNAGFRLLTEQRSNSFGDAAAIFASDGFVIRICQDRGDSIIEFAQSTQKKWHSVENILTFLGVKRTGELVDLLEDTFPRISELMNSDLEIESLIAFEKVKAEETIKRLFPRPVRL